MSWVRYLNAVEPLCALRPNKTALNTIYLAKVVGLHLLIVCRGFATVMPLSNYAPHILTKRSQARLASYRPRVCISSGRTIAYCMPWLRYIKAVDPLCAPHPNKTALSKIYFMSAMGLHRLCACNCLLYAVGLLH